MLNSGSWYLPLSSEALGEEFFLSFSCSLMCYIINNTGVVMHICDRICENVHCSHNYKYRFEILKAVYLQNAWCIFYAILQSIVIQGNSIGVLSSGLLAELPAILDSFFTNTTSDFIGVVGRGWWGATKWQGKTHVK